MSTVTRKKPSEKLSGAEYMRRRNLTPGNPGNSGGKAGRSGRKRVAFRAECERLADDELLPRIEKKLKSGTPDDQGWRWAAEKVLEYGKSKPAQTVKHADPDGNALSVAQIHVHVGDNGRGLEPPIPVTTNGNGRRA